MVEILTTRWRMILIRGLAAVLFGVLAVGWPEMTLLVLILLLGAHALIDGVAALILGWQLQRMVGAELPWTPLLMVGAISIGTGVLAILWPQLTATALVFLLAFWAISRGIFEMVAAIQFRRVLPNEWSLIAAGGMSVLLGILFMIWPAVSLLALMWLGGLFIVMFGFLECLVAWRLRRFEQQSRTIWRVPQV